MTTDKQLRRSLHECFSAKQDAQQLTMGLLGNYEGKVSVPNRPDYVYVRVGDQVHEAYAKGIPEVADTQVYIGKNRDELDRPQVLGWRTTVVGANQYAGARVQKHAEQHRYLGAGPGGGSDVVWGEGRQLLPMRPGAAGSLSIDIYRATVYTGNGVIDLPTTTVDLTSLVPVTTGKALWALIWMDMTGAIKTTAGDEVDIASLAYTDVPWAPGDAMHVIGAVRLYEGQTTIYDDTRANGSDILDFRWPLWSRDNAGTQRSIIVVSPDGATMTHFPADDAGLDDASDYATSGSTVLIPTGEYILAHTLTAGVTYLGQYVRAVVFREMLTFGDGANLGDVSVYVTGSSADPITAVTLANGGIIDTCIIQAVNNGAGDARGVSVTGGGSTIYIPRSSINATAASGDGYSIYCAITNISAVKCYWCAFDASTTVSNTDSHMYTYGCTYPLPNTHGSTMEGDGFGGSGDIEFDVDGTLAAAQEVGGWYISPRQQNIYSVHMYLDYTGTSGSTAIDVNLNGTSILSAPYEFAATSASGAATVTPATLGMLAGDVLTVDIDTSASGARGLKLVMSCNPSVSDALSLNSLTDVAITSASSGDTLRYDGALWVNSPGGGYGADVLLNTTVSASAGEASFSVSGISAGYTHLEIMLTGQSNVAAEADSLYLEFNGDTTAANYRYTSLYGGPANDHGSSAADEQLIGGLPGATYANGIGVTKIIIYNYDNATSHKLAISDGGNRYSATNIYSEHDALAWESTAAITAILLKPKTGTAFKQYSRCTVLGWRAL